jgi:hypothetical protein
MKKNNWDIKLIQDRYAYLKLTSAQAEKVLEFENEYKGEPFFSDWEEFDYQTDFFKTILTKDQFSKFEKEIKRQIKIVEQDMIKNDSFYSNQVKCNTEKLKYIKTIFLPGLFKDSPLPVDLWLGRFSDYQSKIDLLRSSYKEYWQKAKKEILTNHYRYNRTLKPTELKNALLLHDISEILPNYYYFKFKADEPTKATIKFLVDNLYDHYKMAEPILDEKYKVWHDYSSKLWKKHVGESNGFRISVGPNENEMPEYKFISFLLIDPKLYS